MSIKILILSHTAWRNDNSFGNSYSNIFENIENIEIANIYCNYGNPQNNIVTKYFQINEKSLLKNLKKRSYPSGSELSENGQSIDFNNTEVKFIEHVKKNRFQIYFWARNFIWKIGRWKSIELRRFITKINPDILFFPVYYSTYLNDIALFIKKFTNKPLVCYVSDDVYTLRQFSLSPFYWINRIIIRNKVKKVIDNCEYLYVISEIQKREYEKCFKKECRILTKGADFTGVSPVRYELNQPLRLVYTGNIGHGRWKMLAFIAGALRIINANGKLAHLSIYTMTPITEKMKNKLNVDGASTLMGAIPACEVCGVQANSDILVHVESFRLRQRLKVHQSLSTKVVDYLSAGRCIFAVGSMDVASISYLQENDAAVIATSRKEILEKLTELIKHSELVKKYAHKAWECGKRNHQIDKIHNMLYEDLKAVAKGKVE